jgi:hypothetical protein
VDGVWTCCGLKAEAEWWLLVGAWAVAAWLVQTCSAGVLAGRGLEAGALDNVLDCLLAGRW